MPKQSLVTETENPDLARLLNCLSRVPEVREDKVRAVKAQIESGAYKIAPKLQVAMTPFLADVVAGMLMRVHRRRRATERLLKSKAFPVVKTK